MPPVLKGSIFLRTYLARERRFDLESSFRLYRFRSAGRGFAVPGLLDWFVAAIAVASSVCGAETTASRAGWQAAGDPALVQWDGRMVRLRADAGATAGVLSDAAALGRSHDAVLVQAQVQDAGPRAVTFSVHDARSGETVGYWQNPVEIARSTQIAALLPLSNRPQRLRLFAGTHGRSSRAAIGGLIWSPVQRTVSHAGSIYGPSIDEASALGQTFRAAGPKLAAVAIQIRQLMAGIGGPDLRAAVHPWKGDVARSLQAPAVAQTVIPRHLIPGEARESGTDDVSATYGAPPIVLAIPLGGSTTPGETYLLRLTVDGPCRPGQGFLTFGWTDGYRQGELFKNNDATGWDLWLQVYEKHE
jgi:hypothetical protein